MRPIRDMLEERVSAALAQVTGQAGCAAMVRPSADARFGDYQANGVMALAKRMGTQPRKLAEQAAGQLGLEDVCLPPEVAGPGFINLRLRPQFLGQAMREIAADARLGIERAATPKTVVVDYSGPNIAKQMHVGHLRSTIIGDCICLMLERIGYTVKRQNHIGDWGTQFGRAFLGVWHICMGEKVHGKVYHRDELQELKACSGDLNKTREICQRILDRHEMDWKADHWNDPKNPDQNDNLGNGKRFFEPFLEELRSKQRELSLEEVEIAYQYASLVSDLSPVDLSISSRERDLQIGGWQEISIQYKLLPQYITAMLQKGGADNKQERNLWEYLVKQTLDECGKIYKRLKVTLNKCHVRGESAYRDILPIVVEELRQVGLAEESEGAVCVFPEGFKNKEGQRLPFIIQKSEGRNRGYLYATTDLAALRYRVAELKADEIVYVTDARQAQHFAMLFAVARKAGWAKESTKLVHVSFGTMLGTDGKPFKTRSGETVKLKELLDEAAERAREVVEQKNPELPEDQKEEIAEVVGTGAVKYTDYSNNRDSDYVFSFEKMLAMEGNTAPYMQYAYARVRSIWRKAKLRGINVRTELTGLVDATPQEPAEIELAKQIVRYGEAIATAIQDYRPNYITAYLYELAQKFSMFYNACPVLDSDESNRARRLFLCYMTARTIQHGLWKLLRIKVVEQM